MSPSKGYRTADIFNVAGLAAAYVALAQLVLAYISLNGVVSILWPPSGLALAALLLGGAKYWPGIFFGAWIANITAGSPIPVAGGIAVGNTLEALTGYWLLNHGQTFDVSLESPRDYLRLCLASATCACVSAIAGNATLLSSGFLNWQDVPQNLSYWWQGDVLGLILGTPLLMTWRKAPKGWFEGFRALETAALFTLAYLAGQWVFLGWFSPTWGAVAWVYWMFLFAVWAAVRLSCHGVLLVVLMFAIQASVGAVKQIGYFGSGLPQANLLNLWCFITVLTILAMTLAQFIRARESAQAELRRSEAHFRFVTEAAQAMIWLSDASQSYVWFNRTWLNFTGRALEQELGDGWLEAVHPEDRESIQNKFLLVFASREPFRMEFRLRHADGDYRWILNHGVPRYDATGEFAGYIGSCFDITERKRNEQELQLAATVYQAIGEAIMVVDPDHRIISINGAFTDLTGYTEQEAIGQPAALLKSGNHDRFFYRDISHSLKATGRWQGEVINRRKTGEEYLAWLTINTVYDGRGAVVRRVGMLSDITDRKAAEQSIWRQANFDALTGLPNRSMFLNQIKQEIKQADRAGRSLTLMFVDLDRFKEINDTFGHDMGDRLLKEVARRLTACVRETDIVSRLGGDEFTIILIGLSEPSDIERIANTVQQKLTSPFRLGDEVVFVSASIGIALYPEDADSSDTLIKNADQAMYAAKSQGHSGHRYYTASMQSAAQARMQLGNDLRGALSGGELALYYQPIVDLPSGVIRKAEALLRWQHPTRGLLGPQDFIGIAEDTGLISEIGNWVFCEAARQALSWRSSYTPDFQISVNKSPVQFRKNFDHSDVWLGHLREIGLPSSAMAVEVRESSLMETPGEALDSLKTLHSGGIQISLDDFGSGCSSLSNLNQYPIDILKIDRSFIRRLSPDSRDRPMAEAIIAMAHKLGIKLIAKGLETEQQSEFLSDMGCDYGQGYFFSKPLPADEFSRVLSRRH